jgi:arsenate reductase (glutaredoxin)
MARSQIVTDRRIRPGIDPNLQVTDKDMPDPRSDAMTATVETIIYHNPNCGTSRKVLGMLRDAGLEPRVIEYLKTPPTRAELASLLGRMGKTPRQILRRKGTPYDELGLDDPGKSDDSLIDAIMAHPILLERPVVVTPRGVRLCRPAEEVVTLIG